MSDNEYEAVIQQGNYTFPKAAGDLGKGDHIVLKGGPCKIVETSTSKTGKHGHAKSKITAINIFTGHKVEDVLPSSHTVACPFIEKKEFELVSIDDSEFVTYLNEKGDFVQDLKLPGKDELHEFVEELKQDFENGMNIMLTICDSIGKSQILSYKENKK